MSWSSILLYPTRSVNSWNKNRLKKDGYDLDMTYIVDNVIAMCMPGETWDQFAIRNDSSEVKQFLDERHPGQYLIFNVSQIGYDSAIFDGNVVCYPFKDHHAPPFKLLVDIIDKMDEYIKEKEGNTCVVHCKAGKGRTGVVISAYLLRSLMFQKATKALNFYRDVRTLNGNGVAWPSQRRSVHYYEEYLASNGEMDVNNVLSVHLLKVKMTGSTTYVGDKNEWRPSIVVFSSDFDTVLFDSHGQFNQQHTHKNAQRDQDEHMEELMKKGGRFVTRSEGQAADKEEAENAYVQMGGASSLDNNEEDEDIETIRLRKKYQDIFNQEEVVPRETKEEDFVDTLVETVTSVKILDEDENAMLPKMHDCYRKADITFNVDVEVKSDVYVYVYHTQEHWFGFKPSIEEVIRCQFHPLFVNEAILTFGKNDLDGPHKDDRFPEDFKMHFYFE